MHLEKTSCAFDQEASSFSYFSRNFSFIHGTFIIPTTKLQKTRNILLKSYKPSWCSCCQLRLRVSPRTSMLGWGILLHTWNIHIAPQGRCIAYFRGNLVKISGGLGTKWSLNPEFQGTSAFVGISDWQIGVESNEGRFDTKIP